MCQNVDIFVHSKVEYFACDIKSYYNNLHISSSNICFLLCPIITLEPLDGFISTGDKGRECFRLV